MLRTVEEYSETNLCEENDDESMTKRELRSCQDILAQDTDTEC